MIYKGSTPVYPVKGDGCALTVKKGDQLIWSNLFGAKYVYEKSYEAGHYTQKTATGMRFKCYGAQVLTTAWVSESLKPSTTYIITCTLKFLSSPDGYTQIASVKGLLLYGTASQPSVYMLRHDGAMTAGDQLEMTTTFTTPESLDGYKVLAYSDRWKDDSGETDSSTIGLQKLCIAEQTGVEEVTAHV